MVWARAEWDRVVALLAIALGGIALFLGYLGVSNSPYVAEQLSYLISGGVGGLFLLGLGATILVSADLHDEWRKLDQIETAIRESTRGTAGSSGPESGSAPTAQGSTSELVRKAGAVLEAASSPAPSTAPRRGMVLTPEPARAAQSRAVLVLAGIGGALALVWLRASGQGDAAEALGSVSQSTAVLLVGGAVAAAYLAVLRHGVALRSLSVVGAFANAADATSMFAGYTDGAGQATYGATRPAELLIGRGMSLYHVAGCPVLATVNKPRRVRLGALPKGTAPCQLCDAPTAPDGPTSG